MTVGNFGRKQAAMAALASAMLAAGTPVFAQDAATPAPAPSRPLDFRLPPADDGRTPGVQGPADNGLPPVAPGERRGPPNPTPAPTPVPTQPAAPPRVTPTQPATVTTPAPAPARRDAPATAVPRPSVIPDTAASTPPATTESPALPPLDTTSPAPVMPDVAPVPADDTPAPAAPVKAPSGTPLWAWLLAGLAATGAGFWYWRRRAAVAGPATEEVEEAPRAVIPPAAQRKPASPPTPRPAAPGPAPATAVPAAPLVTRVAGEQRAIVGMALDIRSIRLAPDHVAVGFALNLLNQGTVAATSLMVRIALNQGSAMPEPVLGRFFDGAGGSVLRDDIMLAPGAGEQLSSEVMLPRAGIEPLMIGGKPMLIPVIAFDVTYHWDGEGEAFGQNAGSFVLGREGPDGGEKLAPLPLDRASYSVDRPGVRSTAIRRSQ